MSEQVNFVQDSVDRMEEAFRSIDKRVQVLQKDLRARRRSIEKQVTSGRKNIERQVKARRKDIEKRTRKQVKELQKNSLVKRAFDLRDDTTRQVENSVDSLLGFFNVATKSDLNRIDRKIGQLNRKLKGLEPKKRTNGTAAPRVS